MMEVYEVGPDNIEPNENENFLWVVTWYQSNYYEGSGEMIALNKDGSLHEFNLSHCSCNDPLEDWWTGCGQVVSKEAYLGGNALLSDNRSEVYEKVKSLLEASSI